MSPCKTYATCLPRLMKMAIQVLLLAGLPAAAFASGGDTGLPFESGMTALVDSITGPIAFGVSVIGVVAAGAMLIFGGDMNGFMRSIVFLVLVIGLIVGATAILSKMFGVSGSVVALASDLTLTGIC